MKKLSILLVSCLIPFAAHSQEPLNVSLISQLYDFWGSEDNIEVSGSYAYIADLLDGLRILNISDPTSPVEVVTVGIYGPKEVHLMGNYCILSDRSNQATVVDIVDPGNPDIVGSITLDGGRISGFRAAGGYGYFAMEDSGLVIVDFSSPDSPEEIGQYINPNGGRDVEIIGSTLFLGSQMQREILVLDVSSPASPQLLGTVATTGDLEDFSVSANLLTVAEGDAGVEIFDISTPASISHISTVSVSGEAKGVFLLDDALFIADEYFGLQTVDMTIPSSPTEHSLLDLDDSVKDVWVVGDYAYLTGNMSAVHVIDIQDLAAPLRTGGVGENGMISSIACQNDTVAIGLQNGYFRIVDASDPSHPAEIGVSPFLYQVWDLSFCGDYLYTACEEDGIFRLDISDPASPVIDAEFQTTSQARALAVDGEKVFVADCEYDGGAALSIVDFALSTPAEIGRCSLPDVEEVHKSGNYVYVAGLDSGLVIVDVSNLADPFICAEVDLAASVMDVTVSGEYAIVAAADSGVVILDITDPANPVPLGNIKPGWYATSVSVQQDHVILGDWVGLFVIDIANPTDPQITGYHPGAVGGTVGYGNHVYATAWTTLAVFSIEQALPVPEREPASIPTTFKLHSPYPNPFNPSLHVVVGLPQTAELRVVLYNIAGRLVAVLADGRMQAGYQNFVFNGSQLASGVYFIRAVVPGQMNQIRKVVLMK